MIYLLSAVIVVVCFLLAWAIWSGFQFIRAVNEDLDKQRDRDYPERCHTCHLFPDRCMCERYRVPQGFNSPARIRNGVWN